MGLETGKIRPWLANPGNIITLVLAVVTLGSAFYNAAASRDSQLAESLTMTKANAEQIRALNEKFEKTIDLFNRHIQWSEGRSANVEELARRVERLERLSETRGELLPKR